MDPSKSRRRGYTTFVASYHLVLQCRVDSVARSSKKQKAMLVKFDMPLPDDPDKEGGKEYLSEVTLAGEKST